MRWNPPVELSAREALLCERLAKHRRFYRFLRLHRHTLFDEAFQAELAALYSDTPRGTPPLPPARLATAVLLQAYANVSDQDAVQLAETDARWQLALDCLGASDAPFKKTTLVDFRARLVRAGAHHGLLRRTVELAKQTQGFGYKQAAALRIALDSVPREGAGKVEDTINLLGRALRMLAGTVAALCALEPQELYAQLRLPVLSAPSIKAGLDRHWAGDGETEAAVHALYDQIGTLRRWMATNLPTALLSRRAHDADVRLKRLMAQDLEDDEHGGVRIRQAVVPDRQISLCDPEMRHGRKSETVRISGYKEYVALDLEHGLTLAAGVLPANAAEALGADKLRPFVEQHGVVEELHLDRAFLSSAWARERAAKRLDAVVGRAPVVTNQGRYPKGAFTIDVEARTVTCPAGKRVTYLERAAQFPDEVCEACPQRASCQKPNAKSGRTILIAENEPWLQAAAAAVRTPAGRAQLRQRVGVEHALAHQVRRHGPRARYFGVLKNDFDACRAAAVNNLLVIDRRVRVAEAAQKAA